MIRDLGPIFGRGLFLSTGEEWKHQRQTAASAFAPRAVRILARHVAAGNLLVADLTAPGKRQIDLVRYSSVSRRRSSVPRCSRSI